MLLLFFLIKAALILLISFHFQIEFREMELTQIYFLTGVFTQALMLEKLAWMCLWLLAHLERAISVLLEFLKEGRVPVVPSML